MTDAERLAEIRRYIPRAKGVGIPTAMLEFLLRRIEELEKGIEKAMGCIQESARACNAGQEGETWRQIAIATGTLCALLEMPS